jgi:hypothetical protein
MAFSGILAATLATGCFGGGPGYSDGAYNSNYSSYGSSYPYSGYKVGIRIREVLGIHIMPVIRKDCELTRIATITSMP